jgi:hypothetical protein
LTDPHSNRPLKGEAFTELSDEDIEARIAGVGRTKAAARPVRGRRTQARPRGVSSRDTFLLLAIVVVASLALKAFWTSQPASALSTPSPRTSGGTAQGSTAPRRTLGPGETLKPGETLGAVAPSLDANSTPTPSPAAPTAAAPTPTRAPGSTPRTNPTPVASHPVVTPAPTPVPTPPTATLIVYVVVVNDDGGTATPDQFLEYIGGAAATPLSFSGSTAGTPVTIAANKTFSVNDSGPTGYTKTKTVNCSSSLGGVLAAGQSYACTITRDDIAPSPTPSGVLLWPFALPAFLRRRHDEGLRP